MVEIDLTDEIRQLGVSKVVNTNSNLYIYNGESFVQSKYYPSTLSRTFNDLKAKMIDNNKFGNEDKIDQILFKVSKKCADLEGDKEEQRQEKKNKKSYYIQKYRGNDFIAEAVLIAGKPFFALTNANNDNITLCESVEDIDAIFM